MSPITQKIYHRANQRVISTLRREKNRAQICPGNSSNQESHVFLAS